MTRVNTQSIGMTLAMMEQRARQVKRTNNQARRQRWLNNASVWIFCIMLGIMLGYALHMKQMHNIIMVKQTEWTNNMYQEIFKPIRIINSIKGDR